MGRTISLYSSTAIPLAAAIDFFTGLGGEIVDPESIDVSVTAGESRVWGYGLRAALAGAFETPDDRVPVRLGAPVATRLDLQLSHHAESGPLALEIGRQFSARWPSVATCAAYDVLTAQDVARMSAGGRWVSMLGREVDLLWAAPEPGVGAEIEGLSGMALDAHDVDMIADAEEQVRALNGGHLDPTRERVIGMIPAGNAYVWILGSTGPTPAVETGGPLDNLVTQTLGTRAAASIGVLIGYGASREAQRVALLFSERALRSRRGVLMGLFEMILDAVEMEEMLRSGRGLLIA
ncbi:Hypothetical protein A7982_00473 [Minicystis rosea]|nr:Hypothetical protein A7982_00473 [Minicystis rosea]